MGGGPGNQGGYGHGGPQGGPNGGPQGGYGNWNWNGPGPQQGGPQGPGGPQSGGDMYGRGGPSSSSGGPTSGSTPSGPGGAPQKASQETQQYSSGGGNKVVPAWDWEPVPQDQEVPDPKGAAVTINRLNLKAIIRTAVEFKQFI